MLGKAVVASPRLMPWSLQAHQPLSQGSRDTSALSVCGWRQGKGLPALPGALPGKLRSCPAADGVLAKCEA
jgi:hypothetical protein